MPSSHESVNTSLSVQWSMVTRMRIPGIALAIAVAALGVPLLAQRPAVTAAEGVRDQMIAGSEDPAYRDAGSDAVGRTFRSGV